MNKKENLKPVVRKMKMRPKKTTIKRKEYLYGVANAFEIDVPRNGIFYFETLNNPLTSIP